MTSYYVSTPRYTIRVDVTTSGRIAASSARYVFRNYGAAWAPWLAGQKRTWGTLLWVVELGCGEFIEDLCLF